MPLIFEMRVFRETIDAIFLKLNRTNAFMTFMARKQKEKCTFN